MLPSLPIYNQLNNALTDPVVQAALAAQQAAALTNTTTTPMNGTNTNGTDAAPTGSRDTTFTKIFVGGLPYHTTDETLHNYFRQFGDIEEAVVITDRQTQKSRGYGFVTMKERMDAEKACRDPNPIIDGRKANVNLAYLGAKPRNNAHLAAISNSLNQFPQLQAAQLQAAIQLQQQQQRLGLAASVGATPQHLYLQNSTAATAAAIAAAQQQAIQQQLAAVNPLAAIQLSAQNAAAQQPQNAATFAALAAQQAALLQQQQQASALSAAVSNGAMDYNQLLLAAAAAQQQQQHQGGNQSAASMAAAGYVLPTASAAQIDYSNAVAAAYPFLQQSNTSTSAVTSVTNAQSYAAQLAAQAQLAAAAAASTTHGKKTSSNSDSR